MGFFTSFVIHKAKQILVDIVKDSLSGAESKPVRCELCARLVEPGELVDGLCPLCVRERAQYGRNRTGENSDGRRERAESARDHASAGASDKVAEAYRTLNCASGDSDEIVKKQYRSLMKDYHPDVIQSKGLPDDFIKYANTRSREIKEAYDLIMETRKQRS
jgi:hypothetical protein